MYKNMKQYLTIEAIVLKLKELATPTTWSISEYASMVLVEYTDQLNRTVKVQINKDDEMHHVRINDVRELVGTSRLVSYLN